MKTAPYFQGTGRRKTSVARVILNLDEFITRE